MRSFAKILIIPVLFGAISLAGAILWKEYTNSSETLAWIVGCAVFCILMALWNHFHLSIQSRQLARKLKGIWEFEEELVQRIRKAELSGVSVELQNDLSDRLTVLETAEAKRNNLAKKSEAIDDFIGYEDEKVVLLQTKRTLSERLTGKQSSKERKKDLKINESLSQHSITVRLQPIVNLVNKEISAVEAIGYVETTSGPRSSPELIDGLSTQQLCEFDQLFIQILAQVARKMQNDGQSMPIYFTLHSAKVGNHETWPEIIAMLRADTHLTKVLYPQVPISIFSRLGSHKIERFLELKEYGLRPCVSNCADLNEILTVANQKRVNHFKVPVQELLKYTSKEGERVADVLLPKLRDLKIIPIATDIKKAHEAANLIDLDIILGQGDFISPERDIDLGKAKNRTPANV